MDRLFRSLPRVEARTEQMLWPEYLSEPGFDFSDGMSFYAEPASRWLGLGGWVSHAITKMEKIGSESKLKRGAFLNWYNMNAERSLDYRVEWDSVSGRPNGEVVASSLADLLMVQLVSAVEADVKHHRCEQCRTYFPVRPGVARPEKKYCSPIANRLNHRGCDVERP